MARPALNRPTDGELEILRVLWERGPSTVRDVLTHLPAGRRQVGYTGVLKLMQIMTDKGLLARDNRQRSHVYRAAAPQEQTQRHLVKDLLDRAFGGSARALVLQALSARKATAEELTEIRELIDRFRQDGDTSFGKEPPPGGSK
jgi:predicted transcriptional regulator